MSARVPFLAYVRDFELACLTDDWSRIAPHFTPDAERHVAGARGLLAAADRGREAVVGGLARGVCALDRRFDVRVPEILEGPELREDGLWMRWRLGFARGELPELEIEGEHVTRHRTDGIARIEERVAPGHEERAEAYLEEHASALRSPGSPQAPPTPLAARRVRRALQRSMVRVYAGAKSQQDVPGALACCAPDFRIETIPFGLASRDRADTAGQLALFFEAFPDYRANGEGLAVQSDQLAWWGTITVTSRGPILGLPPTGRRAELPAFSVFDFRGAELTRERFHFDLAALCDALALPLPEIRTRLASLRTAAAA